MVSVVVDVVDDDEMLTMMMMLLLLLLFYSLHPGDTVATLRLRACYLLSIHSATKTQKHKNGNLLIPNKQ